MDIRDRNDKLQPFLPVGLQIESGILGLTRRAGNSELHMELIPKPETTSPDTPLRKELPRASASNQSGPKLMRPEAKTGKKEGDSYRGTRSGRAYVPLEAGSEEQQLSGQEKAVAEPGKNGKAIFWIIVVVAAGLALGATYWSWHQFGDSSTNLLSLTAADVD